MRRLGRLAQGGIEAGWLSTVILVPLFINRNGSQVYDFAKVGVLRALAIWMLVMWSTELFASPAPAATAGSDRGLVEQIKAWARVPLVVPALLVLASTMLSTLLSISPHDSFWGRPDRAQGALTLLAQVVIFFATLCNLRTSRQLQRLITALILPSLPIALYAIFQRLALEPLNVTVRETDLSRATSLLGQPVFLAAYLALVAPFTALRVFDAWRAVDSSSARRWLTLSLYVALLLLQASAALFTESRGPLLGVTAGVGIALLAIAARQGARSWVIGLWSLAGVAALAFALGLPARLLDKPGDAEQARMARRAADTFEVEGSGGQFRVTAWKTAERVLRHREALEFADGTHDPRSSLRTLVGYGPEVQYAISPPFYDAQVPLLFGYFLMDRYHNDLWDALLTSGALGLLAWLVLQSSLLWQLMRGLGLLQTAMRVRAFWLSYVGGAAVGVAGWLVLRDLSFCFLGLQMGAALGLALFLSGVGLLGKRAVEPSAAGAPASARLQTGVLFAVLAASISHLVETSFSFTVTTTGALFWIACALVVVCSGRLDAARSGADRVPATPAIADVPEPQRDGLLLGLTLLAVGFSFLGGNSTPGRPGDVLWDGLTLLASPQGAHYPVVALMALATLGFGALLLALEPRPRHDVSLLRHVSKTLGWALPIATFCWLRFSFILAQRALPVRNTVVVVRNLDNRIALTTSFYLIGLILLLWLAWQSAARPDKRELPSAHELAWWRPLAAVAVACVGLWLVFPCSLQPASAEAATALGDAFRNQGKLALSDEAYRKAVELEPRSATYPIALAKLYAKRGRAEPAHAATWFQRADEELREAIALNPIASENATNAAVIRSNWVQRAPQQVRAALGLTIPGLFARALRLHPKDPALWRAWASAQVGVLHEPENGLESVKVALALEPQSAANLALLAEYQLNLARSQEREPRRLGYLAAATSYDQASKLAPQTAAYRLNAGKAYLEAGAPAKAAENLRAALTTLPAGSPAGQSAIALLQRAESETAQ